ncbi:MAG: hypothetical protein ETSY1_28840 [Candidatus Entotheonella factor]|uniref:UGSC-like domain-containing protein n=1 Tax=Entotheonella factor TaxID=1429438 RepID=W4LD09_ENTF1|nr:MAG: hypothetical protein ETSY1_28840 [Candidatus Entotheonella factor]
MVAIERAGIPAVGIVARSFDLAWQSCTDGWGQPSTAFITIPHSTTGQTADFIHRMVDEQIDGIVQGLTVVPAAVGARLDSQASRQSTEIFTVEMDATPEGLDAVNRFLAERDWSDGLPVIPPTPEAVEQMLQGTRRQPQDVLMVMEPGFGLATVEKIAINAVMAGCRPEQFPVLLAAIDCLAQPQMNHRDMQVSGHTEAPLILVNGPVAKRAGINSGTTAMGPGVINHANTAIGRALRLCLINIGYCKAGAGDPNYIGLPTKFGMCIAENEEVSPWTPYHVDQGFKRDESAVTVVTVTGPTTIIDSGSRSPEQTLDNIASMMFYRNAGAGAWIRGLPSAQVGHSNKRVTYQSPYHPIILSPSRAVILAEAGMSKQDAQAWLHRHCRLSLQSALGARGMPVDAQGKWLTHPELQPLASDPEATIPALEHPEQYLLFVSGGSTHYANFFYGTYGIATMPVEEG